MFITVSNINPYLFTTRPEIGGVFGVVTSTQGIATAAGMAMLGEGGNALDAVVATAFTLQVVEPQLNGPIGTSLSFLQESAAPPPIRAACRVMPWAGDQTLVGGSAPDYDFLVKPAEE